MFRKLYWVTEQVDSLGISHVTGVYTSIPDLIRHGPCQTNDNTYLRLTLAKLDSENEPFGTWSEPDFSGIGDKLNEFVITDEFSIEHCQMLLENLEGRARIAA